MRKNDVMVGASYVAKVSGKLTRVRIDRESPHGGWEATNADTGRRVRIKSAQRLRYPAGNGTGRKPAPVQPEAPVEPDAVAPDDADELEDFDPDICATAGCGAAAAMTYLGRPRCQACFEDDVQDNEETTDDDSPTPNDEENDMATKKTTKKSAKKATKATKAPKAPKAPKPKATSPKAARKPAGDATPKRISALDAAATVLQKAGEPMNAKAMIGAMAEQGLWTSPNGKTPHATLYAAILREIGVKGGEARFRKSDRGMFEYAG
jgi:hypothetical protein